ncbi:MAG: hypothetical protein NC081_09635 [Roseburia sp.]|nr:hypothetical protein [Roseburia sp.]
MVEHILGNYLMETGRISKVQLRLVLDRMDSVRVKLGLIAVSEGFMTFAQAEEVNRLQALQDKRFGDIAIEKGYLTEEQVGKLLKAQQNTFLTFAQALVDEQIIKMEQLEDILEGFRKANDFSNTELEDIKSDEIERIVPVLLPGGAEKYKEPIEIVMRSMVRLIDRHTCMGKAVLTETARTDNMVVQELRGDKVSYLTCFQEGDGALLTVGSFFGQMEFETLDEDALDAAAELLNCVNGLFASARSRNGQFLELMPPQYAVDGVDVPKTAAYKVPIYIENQMLYFIIAELV